MRRVLVLLLLLLAGSCAIYREDLNRAQRLYDENEYVRALAIFRALEEDLDSLSVSDQARYAYLRGMTDYRLGSGQDSERAAFRANARHWLAVASAIEQQHPGGLNADWKQRLASALDELNRETWGIAPEAAAGGNPRTSAGAAAVAGSAATLARDGGAPAPQGGGKCGTSADCAPGETCQAGECIAL